MKKYFNTSRRLVCITFSNADDVYLRRGQSIETDATAVLVPDEVVVTPVAVKKIKDQKDQSEGVK